MATKEEYKIEKVILESSTKVAVRCTKPEEWLLVKEVMLKGLADKDNKFIGICTVLRFMYNSELNERLPTSFNRYAHHYSNMLKVQMLYCLQIKGWWSGCGAYPIADPKHSYFSSDYIGIAGMTYAKAKKLAAKRAYHTAPKWDKRTVYGKRRHATMDYILEYIDAIINHLKEKEQR